MKLRNTNCRHHLTPHCQFLCLCVLKCRCKPFQESLCRALRNYETHYRKSNQNVKKFNYQEQTKPQMHLPINRNSHRYFEHECCKCSAQRSCFLLFYTNPFSLFLKETLTSNSFLTGYLL